MKKNSGRGKGICSGSEEDTKKGRGLRGSLNSRGERLLYPETALKMRELQEKN